MHVQIFFLCVVFYLAFTLRPIVQPVRFQILSVTTPKVVFKLTEKNVENEFLFWTWSRTLKPETSTVTLHFYAPYNIPIDNAGRAFL